MMNKQQKTIGTTDYVIILGFLGICVFIGLYHKLRPGTKSTGIVTYFLANRKMPMLPIAMSILATTVSAVPMVSGIGELYTYGMEYTFVTVGIIIGTVFCSYYIIPVFRHMDCISIYKYLEKRFDRSVRVGFSFLYILMNVITSGVVIYVPALLISQVTDLPYWITASISGILCTAYCILGGFKSVVWTDVVQLVFMLTGLTVIIIRGSISAGGSSFVWKEAFVEGFFENLRWTDSNSTRYSVLSGIFQGMFIAFQYYTTSQAVMQRILSVKDTKTAQKSLMLTILLRALFAIMLLAAASVVFANLHKCDPLLRVEETGVKSPDYILLYFMLNYLTDIPGLSGIVLTGILSSALSTLSSSLNSFSATTVEDFIKPFFPGLLASERKEVLLSQGITGLYGILVLCFSFTIPYMGGAIKTCSSVIGAVGGPLTGFMFLALFFRKANKKSNVLALITGVSFCSWIAFVSPFYRRTFRTLPLSTDSCLSTKNLTEDLLLFQKNVTTNTVPTPLNDEYVFILYKIPFVWYGTLGILVTVAVGVIASLFFRDNKEINEQLLSPLVFGKKKMTTVVKESAQDTILLSESKV